MKIKILKNFGLNGENLEKGTTVEIDPTHFGDNIGTFRDEEYFEEVVATPEPAEAPSTLAAAPAPPTETAIEDTSGFKGLNRPIEIKTKP